MSPGTPEEASGQRQIANRESLTFHHSLFAIRHSLFPSPAKAGPAPAGWMWGKTRRRRLPLPACPR